MANYKITDIEGIGPAFGEKLSAAGVHDTDTLLSRCASAAGRRELAKATGIGDSYILKWTNMADLYRVKGIGSEYSELLEAAGVDTVKELATRNATNLAAKMQEVNAQKSLTRKVPSEAMCGDWIQQAKGLPPTMTY